MKKRVLIILCAALVVVFITACSGANHAAPDDNIWIGYNDDMDFAVAAPAAPPPPAAPQPPAMSEPLRTQMMDMPEEEIWDSGEWNDSSPAESVEHSAGGTGATEVSEPVIFSEKIIYSVHADIETMNFDDSIDGVHEMMARYGAFIENSSVRGVHYESQFRGWTEYRFAYFSIRVPVENLSAMTGRLDSLGNVISENSNATNITSQFYDTQSHLNSLTVQEERLLELLAKAEDVPDLILIEERLSNVRYQIESLTTTLNNWQNQVSYSTITLSIFEVEQFTERTEIHRTYWQQIGDGFMATIRAVGRFFMNLFMGIIISAPVLIILAVVAVAVLFIVRRKLRSIAKKKKAKQSSTPEEKEQE